jgi:hypothetical protein
MANQAALPAVTGEMHIAGKKREAVNGDSAPLATIAKPLYSNFAIEEYE